MRNKRVLKSRLTRSQRSVLPVSLELDPAYSELLDLARSLAKTHERSISYTSLVVTKLVTGEKLNSHVDDKNHGYIPNHTICFGDYKGGQLQ
eukprot:106154-Amphidinium_carterae.1